VCLGAIIVEATLTTSQIEWINSINGYSIGGGREANQYGRYLRRLEMRGESTAFFFVVDSYFEQVIGR